MNMTRIFLMGALLCGLGLLRTAPASAQESCNTPAYYYLTCGATGYALTPATRLTQENQAEYSVTYSVTQPYMTDSGDTCFVVETHTLDAYDNCSKRYDTVANPLVVPSTSELAQAGSQFYVRYPALGAYKATLTLHSGLALSIRSAP